MTSPGAFDSFGLALRLLRERRGLSQVALQEAAGLGASTVSDWERGTSSPRLDSIAALLRAMKFSLRDLVDALDVANGRAPERGRGNANPRWVAALSGRALNEELLRGFAAGAVALGDPQAREDFVASVELVAGELARRAIAAVDDPAPTDGGGRASGRKTSPR